MPFAERDQTNTIVGLYARPQPGRAEEAIDADHPDAVAFRTTLESKASEPSELETLKEMLRDGDPSFDAKIDAARQRIINRRP